MIDFYFEFGEKVILIGWSFGGVIVCEVICLFVDSVCEVIIMGMLIVGGFKYIIVGGFYVWMYDIDFDEFEVEVYE